MTSRTPEYYSNKLKELNQNYYLILNEYIQQYPKSKTYSKIPSYAKSLDDDKINFEKIQTDFFILKNELEKEIENAAKDIKNVDKMIIKLNKDNKKLNNSLSNLEQSSETAIGMFNDAQKLYNEYLLGNTYLFFGIIGVGLLMYRSNK